MKSQIRQMVNNVFQQMQDLKKNAVFKHKTGEEFDPAEGKTVATYSETPVEIFIGTFDKRVIDNDIISVNDQKVYMPAGQVNFTPQSGDDYLVIDDKSHQIGMVQSKFQELYIIKI